MTAFESGEPIERLDLDDHQSVWEVDTDPFWDWCNFKYRVAITKPTEEGLGKCLAYGVISRNEFGGGIRASNALYHSLEPGKRYYARLYEYDESRWS